MWFVVKKDFTTKGTNHTKEKFVFKILYEFMIYLYPKNCSYLQEKNIFINNVSFKWSLI